MVLAKALSGRVVTNDFNLNKIAQLQGVDVINLNELANALKTVALPGEIMPVRIVKPGDQIGQGVGYLDDGTMVVVEQGRSADRPGGRDHGDQRAADAGRPDDLRPARSAPERLADAVSRSRRRGRRSGRLAIRHDVGRVRRDRPHTNHSRDRTRRERDRARDQ